MKKTLLILMCLSLGLLQAQTTHNLDWEIGANGPEMDLTIDVGDTVVWTWTDGVPHTVENVVGNSVETFNSGTLTGIGQTFSFTFNVVGVNDYFCGIHGAGNMSGTITVQDNLGLENFEISQFLLRPNPVTSELNIQLPGLEAATIEVFDVLGKRIFATSSTLQEQTVEVSSWNKGVYIVRVSTATASHTKRFIKQ